MTTTKSGTPTNENEELYEDEETEGLDPGEIDVPTSRPASRADDVSLRSNKLMSEEGIYGFRNQHRVRTVVLVGEQKTGKTTLLAALYGLFCKGPVGGIEFVGSRTLYSFAERNHLAMMKPDRSVPTTPRTSIGDLVGYFHLALANAGSVIDLVIADRSGETFESARVDTSLTNILTELVAADRVCFLLDAARLTNVETRAGYRRTFKQTIRALIDNGAIPQSAVIEVLVTKVDRISRIKDGRDLSAEVGAYEAELLEEFEGADNAFEVHRICALPRASVRLGFVGMDELVARWTAPLPDADIRPGPVQTALRYIDRSPNLWS